MNTIRGIQKTSRLHLKYHFQSTATLTSKQQPLYANPSRSLDGYELVHAIPPKLSIPALGFGTWGVNHFSNNILAQATDIALKIGYRHLDCARVYDNENEIGAVIHDHLNKGTFDRNELFLTSKLFNHEHDNALFALESSLKALNVDYVDCFLIHWPFRNNPNMQYEAVPFSVAQWFLTYKSLHELSVQGLTKSVGVCNATVTKMKGLMALCDQHKVPYPANLQVELHPYLQQEKVLQFGKDHGIIITAAMPLGSPERPPRCRRDDDPVIMDNLELKTIAKETGYSVAQVIIRWHLQKGVVCIPKGTEEWMIRENFETLNFELTCDQMERINALDKNFRFSRAEFLGWRENQSWEELWDDEDTEF